MTTENAAHLFVIGTLAGMLLTVTPVAAFVATLRAYWRRTAVRVVGSWIAASGLLLIAFQLRGVWDEILG